MRLTAVIVTLLAFIGAVSETRIVHVGDFFFQDQDSMTSHTRINVGDTVRWEWISGNHTTTEVDKLWNASINSITQTYERVFDEPGLWEYFCAMDPLVMRGTVQVDGVMTHVQPFSLDVSPGVIVSGGLQEVLASDDKRLVMRPGIVFSSASYPIIVDAIGLVPPGTGENALTIRVESQASSGVILQRIRLYNYFEARWDEVRLGFCTVADGVVEATINDPLPYVTPATGMTMAEISYRAAGLVFAYPWQARIDQIEWIAQ